MPLQTWDHDMLSRYSGQVDQGLVIASAEALEKEAVSAGGGSPEGAYRWLFLNGDAIQNRMSIFSPGGIEHRCAYGFLKEHFYVAAVSSPMHSPLVHRYFEEYVRYVETEAGTSFDDQIHWLNENIPQITVDNIRTSDDWHVRNRAVGLLQKQFSLQKAMGKPAPINWADTPPGS